MHLPVSTLLQGGKYKIVRFISSGGFGCTYEAEHVMLEKRVAIKEFFVKDFCNRDETTAHVTVGTVSKRALVDKLRHKFVDEAKALCRLQHSGIVKVSDVFEENGTAYFVMDYVDGLSLGDIVKRHGAMPEARAVRYIRQVAEALRYVHDNNRLHLDIKPGNVMIDADDNAILIDFGTSKQYDEQDGENTSTLMGKTPGYAPLEQMGNDVVKFLPATDIYALGSTLYKLLTGVTPPSANMLASDEKLNPLPAAISVSTRRAIAAAMQLRKSERPQTMGEFLAMLDAPASAGITASATAVPQPETEATVLDDVAVRVVSVTTPTPQPATASVAAPDAHKPAASPPQRKQSFFGKLLIASFCIAIFAAIVFILFLECGGSSASTDSLVILIAFFCVGTIITIILICMPDAKISKPSGSIAGHNYVDLGLSVKWATCNVGAESHYDYGDYFAWGEIATKAEYTKDNSNTYDKNLVDISGNPQYDAACANWGSSWRLPTQKEMQELVDKCTWTWTIQDGHNGYKVTSKTNGNSIFLPAAGWRYRSSSYSVGEYGRYWGAIPDKSNMQFACSLFSRVGDYGAGWYGRYYGHSIRPVSSI